MIFQCVSVDYWAVNYLYILLHDQALVSCSKRAQQSLLFSSLALCHLLVFPTEFTFLPFSRLKVQPVLIPGMKLSEMMPCSSTRVGRSLAAEAGVAEVASTVERSKYGQTWPFVLHFAASVGLLLCKVPSSTENVCGTAKNT